MGSQLPPLKVAHPPIFRFLSIVANSWIDEDATWYGRRRQPRPHCIRRGPSSPRRGHNSSPLFGPCLLWPRLPISATAELLFRLGCVSCLHVVFLSPHVLVLCIFSGGTKTVCFLFNTTLPCLAWSSSLSCSVNFHPCSFVYEDTHELYWNSMLDFMLTVYGCICDSDKTCEYQQR